LLSSLTHRSLRDTGLADKARMEEDGTMIDLVRNTWDPRPFLRRGVDLTTAPNLSPAAQDRRLPVP